MARLEGSIDENAFRNLSQKAGNGFDFLRAILEAVEPTLDAQVPWEVVKTFYELPIAGDGTPLMDWVFGDAIWKSDRDLATRTQIFLAQISFFDPPDDDRVTVKVDGKEFEVMSAGLHRAISKAEDLHAWQCVIPVQDDTDEGEVEIIDAQGRTCRATQFKSRRGVLIASRSLLANLCETEDEFWGHCENAFPNLLLHDDLSFKKFNGGYHATRRDVVAHLSFLNDEFLEIGNRTAWDISQMMGQAKVNFSDESAATKANKDFIRQRDIEWNGKTYRCTLHTKLDHRINRIHFHPPSQDIENGRILVGLFVDHLDV